MTIICSEPRPSFSHEGGIRDGDIKIAVIGAGSAGLVMAKEIIEASKNCKRAIEFTVFERRDDVGGIWQFDEIVQPGYLAWESDQGDLRAVGKDVEDSRRRLRYGWRDRWPPGPMFDGLRTNIPSDLMEYRDVPFDSKTPLFPSRKTVQNYLKRYAEENKLVPHIRFNTSVTSLKKDDKKGQWLLKSRDLLHEKTNDDEKLETFSHIAVCHGRCNTPNIPNIVGLETFQGIISHSAWYRDPSMIKEKNVLIVGNASSGMDIAREMAGYITRTLSNNITPQMWEKKCKMEPFNVYSSWHSMVKAPGMDYNPLDSSSPDWCQRIKVLPQIEHIDAKAIHFEGGVILYNIELIIFATGFLFDNPYIDQSDGVLLTRPLLPPSKNEFRTGFPSQTMYNMDDWLLFHSQDDSIAFLGLPLVIVPFPFTQIQALYVIHRWLQLAPRLPRLDTSIPLHDEKRWSSSIRDRQDQQEKELHNGVILESSSHVISHPSDFAYLDALLNLLHQADSNAGVEPPWQQGYKSDGFGNGFPKGPENRYQTAKWRFERRTNGKRLRRDHLGY